MSKMIITAEMALRLSAVKEKLELRDEWGNLIGYFEPSSVKGGWGPFSAEEVESASRQTGPGKTLDQIFREAGLR